jgi:type IV pilus assembly protein PilM
MGQNVIGLDLGSHTVKAIVLRLGLRGNEIAAIETERVALGEDGASADGAVFAAAARLLGRLNTADVESLYAAVSGDAATIRSVQLPASASRKIEQVLRFELDEALPFPIEEAVFDWVETARTSEQVHITAAVVRAQRVREIVEGLSTTGFDPREIGVAVFAYAVDFPSPSTGPGRGAPEEPTAIVDVGHTRTNVFVANDGVQTARTILRGGRDLTLKLAQAAGVPFEAAELDKRREGLSGGRVGRILADAARPLARELKNTFAGHIAAGGKRIRRVLLCGGGALLQGFGPFLADELGVPVEAYGADLRALDRAGAPSPESMVLAHCLARRDSVEKAKRLNVRRGGLAFRGDHGMLRRRILAAAAFVLVLLGAWIFSSYAEYRLLKGAAVTQEEELKRQTLAFFGKELVERSEIDALVAGNKSAAAPVPLRDAFDIVVELSKRIPTSVVHDIDLLDIKPKRITIRAQVDSELKAEAGQEAAAADDGEGDGEGDGEELQLSPTDLLQQKLGEFTECFSAIRIGKVQTRGERRSYQMDIDSKCP